MRYMITVLLFLSSFVPVAFSAEEPDKEFKAAVAEAILFLNGSEFARAARRATEALFLTDNPESEGWNDALRVALGAMEKWRAEENYPANPVRRLRIYKKYSIMLLLEEGAVSAVYNIYAGPEFSVPSGRFTIGAKLRYPVWKENGIEYKPGDPKNILASRWMELITPDGKAVSGIHGSAQGNPSAGSGVLFFTMDNKDIRPLYNLLREGTVVEVE